MLGRVFILKMRNATKKKKKKRKKWVIYPLFHDVWQDLAQLDNYLLN